MSKPLYQKLAKLFTKAENCTSHKKAKKILKKANKLQNETD